MKPGEKKADLAESVESLLDEASDEFMWLVRKWCQKSGCSLCCPVLGLSVWSDADIHFPYKFAKWQKISFPEGKSRLPLHKIDGTLGTTCPYWASACNLPRYIGFEYASSVF